MTDDEPDKHLKNRYATGREMHKRLARTGPPLDVTTKGLKPQHQPRINIEEPSSRSAKGKEAERDEE